MLKGVFNNLLIMEKALDASWMRNEAISNNISNVDTPNYKRQDVEFEGFLSEALDNRKLRLKATSENHISKASSEFSNTNIKIDTEQNNMRLDGNNVDIDREMALMAKNSIYYQVMSQQINNKLLKLKNTIRDIK